MYSSRSLWVIAVLMSSIPQAHSGRPSSPASPTPTQPQQPQQTPPADPGATTSTTNPTNTPPSSGNTSPADQNNAAQPGFLDTTDGKATAVIGGLATLGVGAVAAKKGYNYYQQRKEKQEKVRKSLQEQEEAVKKVHQKLDENLKLKERQKHQQEEQQEELKKRLQQEAKRLKKTQAVAVNLAQEIKNVRQKQNQERDQKNLKNRLRFTKKRAPEVQYPLSTEEINSQKIPDAMAHLQSLSNAPEPIGDAVKGLLKHLDKEQMKTDHFNGLTHATAAHHLIKSLLTDTSLSEGTKTHLQNIADHLERRIQIHKSKLPSIKSE